MSELPENDPQNIRPEPLPFRGRKRTFPAVFATDPVTGERKLFYRDEWAEIMAQQAAKQHADDTSREAELAAGRPPRHDPPSPAPADSAPDQPAQIPAQIIDAPAAVPPASASDNHDDVSTRSAAIDEAKTAVANWNSSVARQAFSSSSPPPDYERHSRRCTICLHADRDAIEGDFVRWRSLVDLCGDFGVTRSALYRHVHATRLDRRRTVEVRSVMEHFLEEAEHFPVEHFDVVTRAVRAYAHLDEDGRWWEPSRTNYVLTGPFWPDVGPHAR